VLRTAADSDLRLGATNAPPATITNSDTVLLQIGKPDNALIKLASPLFGTSLAVVVWRMFKTQTLSSGFGEPALGLLFCREEGRPRADRRLN
jgi:hypothetical protein